MHLGDLRDLIFECSMITAHSCRYEKTQVRKPQRAEAFGEVCNPNVWSSAKHVCRARQLRDLNPRQLDMLTSTNMEPASETMDGTHDAPPKMMGSLSFREQSVEYPRWN